MSMAPGSSRVRIIGSTSGAQALQGKIFASGKSVRSYTLNPPSPLEIGRTVDTNGQGNSQRLISASSIGVTTASGAT